MFPRGRDARHDSAAAVLEQRDRRLRVFHASSTTPVPKTTEARWSKGWETQLGTELNGAMFDQTDRPVRRIGEALGRQLNGAMFLPTAADPDPDAARLGQEHQTQRVSTLRP